MMAPVFLPPAMVLSPKPVMLPLDIAFLKFNRPREKSPWLDLITIYPRYILQMNMLKVLLNYLMILLLFGQTTP